MIGATNSYQADWDDGYLSYAAKLIGGNWLRVWVIFVAGVSNVGMFQAELSKDALLLTGMAERAISQRFWKDEVNRGRRHTLL